MNAKKAVIVINKNYRDGHVGKKRVFKIVKKGVVRKPVA